MTQVYKLDYTGEEIVERLNGVISVDVLNGVTWKQQTFLDPNDADLDEKNGYGFKQTTVRLATTEMIYTDKEIICRVNDGYCVGAILQSSPIISEKYYTESISFSSECCTIPANTFFVIILKRSDEGHIGIGESTNIITEAVEYNTQDRFNRVNRLNNIVSELSDNVSELSDNVSELNDSLICKNLIGMDSNRYYPVELILGESLTMSTSDGSKMTEFLKLQFYDENKEYLDYYSFPSGLSSRTITVAELISDAKYVKWEKTYPIPLQLERGAKASSYTEYFLTGKASSEYIEDLSEKIDYLQGENNIVMQNSDIDHIIKASCNYGRSDDYYKECLSMLVATDIHCNADRLEDMIFYLNNSSSIDCGISLGDMQRARYGDNDGVWYTEIVNTSNKNFYTVLGNHDMGMADRDPNTEGTPQLAFSKFIAPTTNKIDISDLATPYYTKVYDDYKTVLIVLNTFDAPDTLDDEGKYLYPRTYEMFSQNQINWFISTLNNIPSDYHIVVASHSISFETILVDSNFSAKRRGGYPLIMQYPYGHCTIIPDIINAWINGAAINEEYSSTNSTLPTLVANADFSARGTGDFVCYLIGHDHNDLILKSKKYENQNIISLVTSASTDYYRGHTDLPRYDGKTLNALTVFSVDTQHRQIRLVRVGSNITMDMVDRTFTTIDY